MASSYNRVILMGNLTLDPEIKYTPKGSAVAEVGLAVNRVWFDDQGTKHEEVAFIDVTFWGRQAETVQKYCFKGKPIHIEGRLQLDSWDDKTTGQKRSKLRVIAENMQLLGSAKDGPGGGGGGGFSGGSSVNDDYDEDGPGPEEPPQRSSQNRSSNQNQTSRPAQQQQRPAQPSRQQKPDESFPSALDQEDDIPF